MSNLTPQTVSLLLSLLGVLILLSSLALIATKRVPELKSPQIIKGLGLDLNISLITLLVLVGLILALTSTYLQIRNYDQQISEAQRRQATLETELSSAGKVNVNAVLKFEGIATAEEMPDLTNIYCRYHVTGPSGERWVEPAKVTPGIYPLDLILTLEDITPLSSIERVQLLDRNPAAPRTWELDQAGQVLRPRFVLKRTK